MDESLEVKIARLEGKLDEHFARLEERMDGLNKRLSERFSNHEGRIASLEKSVKRQGERIGKLEASAFRLEGGWWAISKALALGAALGAAGLKIMEWLRG